MTKKSRRPEERRLWQGVDGLVAAETVKAFLTGAENRSAVIVKNTLAVARAILAGARCRETARRDRGSAKRHDAGGERTEFYGKSLHRFSFEIRE